MNRPSQDGFFFCPCCGLPTLETDWFDTCMVCLWEDDGQSVADADQVNLGPNAPCSLTAARANYVERGHMYAADDRKAPPRSPLRDQLLTLAAAHPFDTGAYRIWLSDWQSVGR